MGLFHIQPPSHGFSPPLNDRQISRKKPDLREAESDRDLNDLTG
jgi:hypothetical protein